MKIVLTSEHYREIGSFRTSEEILIFSNKGKSPIEYFLNLKKFILKNDINAIINFGIAGSLYRDLPIGSLVPIRKIFYMDPHSMKFIGPMIDIGSIDEKYENLITLTDIDYEIKRTVSYSGNILDLEGYFISLIGKELNIPVFIFKSVSDYNDIAAIEMGNIEDSLRKLGKKYLLIIKEIVDSPYKTEFYMQYKYYNWYVFKKIEENTAKHKTFTERQYLYKGIILYASENVKNKSQNAIKPRIQNIYIEKDYFESKIAKKFTSNFPEAEVIEIENYLKLFSHPGRDYYQSKNLMNLFIAKKRGRMLKHTPEHYGLPGTNGYAIANMFNCFYDCSYCYLAGYFESGDIVVFVNYDDMAAEILNLCKNKNNVIIYAGDFSDSLLFDRLTGFTDYFYKFLSENYNISMEIRTKRGSIDNLLNKPPIQNLIIAVSVSPESIIKQYETGTMTLSKRIDLLSRASVYGYKIGIRIDPIIGMENMEIYKDTLIKVLNNIKVENVHSIGIGTLRMSKKLYKCILRRRKNKKILHGLNLDKGMYRYSNELRKKYYKNLKDIADKYGLGNQFYITMD